MNSHSDSAHIRPEEKRLPHTPTAPLWLSVCWLPYVYATAGASRETLEETTVFTQPKTTLRHV